MIFDGVFPIPSEVSAVGRWSQRFSPIFIMSQRRVVELVRKSYVSLTVGDFVVEDHYVRTSNLGHIKDSLKALGSAC